LALIFMILDHMAVFFPGTFPIEFRYIGRLAAPIFFFMAVESFFHTSSKKIYLKRLYIAAFIMAAGNILLGYFTAEIFNLDKIYFIYYNIFLSIALCISVIYGLDWLKKQTSYKMNALGMTLILVLSSISLLTEYGYIALAAILIFYFFREKPIFKYTGYFALSFSAMFIVGSYQWLMIFSLPFIYFYNGKKGTGYKYLFYIVYPLSVWIPYFLKLSPWF